MGQPEARPGSHTSCAKTLNPHPQIQVRNLIFGDPNWRQGYTLSFKCRCERGLGSFACCANWIDFGNYDLFGLNLLRRGMAAFDVIEGRRLVPSQSVTPARVELNTWYEVRLESHSQTLACYLDGECFFNKDAASFPRSRSGCVGLTTGNSVVRFRDICVRAEDDTKLLDHWLPDFKAVR